MQPTQSVQDVNTEVAKATATSNQPVQPQPSKIETPKKPSIQSTIDAAWEKYMRSQGLDPKNPPKQTVSRPILPHRCGQYLIKNRIKEMFKRCPQKPGAHTELPKPIDLAAEKNEAKSAK